MQKKLRVKTIHTTVKMHGQLITRSSRHRVNSAQCCCTRQSIRHTILGDIRVWLVDWVTSWLAPVSCFSKIQIVFTFLVPANLSTPGQRAIKWLFLLLLLLLLSSLVSLPINTIECKRYWNRTFACPLCRSAFSQSLVCLSWKCIVAKWLIGSGCHFGWWMGSVEGWVY